MSQLFLGVDGGGTKTCAVVTDGTGRVLGLGEAGPSNYLAVGIAAAVGSIQAASESALAQAGVRGARPASACFGLAGAGRQEDANLLTQALSPLAEQIRVTHDAAVALAGATGGRPGVILIAGTGAIAYGERADGTSIRAGGWGWLLDDAGGGFDLGRKVLQAVLRAHDGRGPATGLTEAVMAHWRLSGVDDLIGRVYRPLMERSEMASLARVAAQVAAAGDAVAQGLWRQAGHDLAEQAGAVLRRLDLRKATVATAGSLWRVGALLREPFGACLREFAPDATVADPLLTPAEGAALLARRPA